MFDMQKMKQGSEIQEYEWKIGCWQAREKVEQIGKLCSCTRKTIHTLSCEERVIVETVLASFVFFFLIARVCECCVQKMHTKLGLLKKLLNASNGIVIVTERFQFDNQVKLLC